MIIKRQKLYTRAERLMWKELHQATNGWRKLPEGWKNMTARDTFRLGNITSGYYNQNLNPDDVKVLATHLNLPQTASTGYKVLQKYSNPDLLNRYRSIRAHKLGVGKEYKEMMALKRQYEALVKQEELAKSQEELIKLQKKTDKFCRKMGDRYSELAEKIENAENSVKDKNIQRIEKHLERQRKYLNKGIKNTNQLPIIEEPELAQKTANFIRNKYGVNHIYLDKTAVGADSWVDTEKRNIHLSFRNKYNPEVIAHEAGHLRNYDRMKRNTGLSIRQLNNRAGDWYRDEEQRIMENPALPLANEYAASRRAQSILSNVGATVKQKADALRELETAYKGYYHKAVGEVPLRFYERL